MRTLTLKEIGKAVPSALATKPSSKLSSQYTFVPTTRIIEDLAKDKWFPVRAEEMRTSKDYNKGFQKHLIRFRNLGFSDVKKVGDTVPEIVVTNSHNGLASFELNAGIYRMVCNNGMVVSDGLFQAIKIKHIGYSLDQVMDATNIFASGLPLMIEAIREYKEIDVTSSRQDEFAEKALDLRWPVAKGRSAPITAGQLLMPRRVADHGNSLWKVFNRVQENIFKGGVVGVSPGSRSRRRYTTVKVKNINEHVRLNKALWELAESYRYN